MDKMDSMSRFKVNSFKIFKKMDVEYFAFNSKSLQTAFMKVNKNYFSDKRYFRDG